MTSLVQQLVNLDAAIALVEQTPARMINLDRWSSNSWWRRGDYPTERQVQRHAFGVQVCLGGLIACDPYFQSLGVRRGDAGAPHLTTWHTGFFSHAGYIRRYLAGVEVSEHLFGSSHLFASGGLTPEKEHKAIALSRLRERRAKVLVLMEIEATSAGKPNAQRAVPRAVLTDPVL